MTKVTIMRSKQTSTTSIGRPLYTSRSQYNGSVIYPQWMRSLEEKYQRIHMKITRSTTAMSNIYNSTLGRNQDKNLLKASLARPRDCSPPKCGPSQYRRVSSSLERGVSRPRISATEIVDNNTNVDVLPKRTEITFHSYLEEFPEERKSNSEEKDSVKSEEAVLNECDDSENSDSDSTVIGDEENIDYVTEGMDDGEEVVDENCDNEQERDTYDDNEIEQKLTVKETELLTYQTNAEENRSVDNQTRPVLKDRNKLSAAKGEHRGQFITQLGKHYNKPTRFITREQIPRTSTSRRSIQTYKTSKSCPATIEHVNASPQPQPKKGTNVRSKSSHKNYKGHRNLNMFSRMSMEAQHAMTETLKEKKPNVVQRKNKNCHEENPNNADNKSSSSENDEEEEQICGRNSASKIPQSPKVEDRILDKFHSNEENRNYEFGVAGRQQENAHSDSEISITNKKRAIEVLSNRTKLPDITDSKYVTLQHLKTLQYTIPGIGRYNVAPKRETTFEITPPGFDIRYKDMMVLEERESETPPPDIRNRAVQKCQDWLTRYTNPR